MQEVLIRSPSTAFAFGIIASQFGSLRPQGRPRRPVHRPSSAEAHSGGTDAVTTSASPSTGIDCPHGIPMPSPATALANIAPVVGVVELKAGWTHLAGVR